MKRFAWWGELTGLAQFMIIAIGVAIIGGGGWLVYDKNPQWFSAPKGIASTQIASANLPTLGRRAEAAPTLRPVYTPAQVAAENVGTLRTNNIAWNAQIGLIFANGGSSTRDGSLMDQYGLDVDITRQDYYDVQMTGLLKFAEDYANGNPDPSVGAQAALFMGDAGPGYFVALQPKLDEIAAAASKKAGRKITLTAVIIGGPGRSLGEDKCMGEPGWADAPRSMLGVKKDTRPIPDSQKINGGKPYVNAFTGVARDGDLHVCDMFFAINGIKINPDATTVDKDAANFFYVGSFADGDKLVINGNCASRPVVSNGKLTGEKLDVCATGPATWTPGDINVTEKRGGLVSLLSTRENASQMFATIVVIREWALENPATVTNFLKAALDGSVLVANDRAKLLQAATWSAQVWGERDGPWWAKAYYGYTVTVPNTDGREIRLGGSEALGLASNLEYFLPGSDGKSAYDRVWDYFYDMDRKLYPIDMPAYTFGEVVETSFLLKIRDAVGAGNVGQGRVGGDFSVAKTQVVGGAPRSIEFAIGSARILPSSYAELDAIIREATVGSELAIQIDGHTSSDGAMDFNQRLSEDRARAVYEYLARKAPGVFTKDRVSYAGYGSSRPVASNDTEVGRAANRRTEISFLQ